MIIKKAQGSVRVGITRWLVLALSIQHGSSSLTFPKAQVYLQQSLTSCLLSHRSVPMSTPPKRLQELVKDKLCVVAEATDTAST